VSSYIGKQYYIIILLELPCKNFKRAPSSGEVMAAVFWDMRGVIFVDVNEGRNYHKF